MQSLFFRKSYSINCRGKLIDLSTPKVMGILNITPDSFYDGGNHNSAHNALEQTSKMLMDGADIIDIGAYSSRPGAKHISKDEETTRLTEILKVIRKAHPNAILSVDTFRSEVAQTVVRDFEVDIINDISTGNMDHNMFKTIADLKVPYIMMHMQGIPQNMQLEPKYKDLKKEVFKFFAEKHNQLKLMGVNDVILDPGFGFGKTLEHNYELLNYLEDLRIFNLPVLVGASRKSMIYKLLDNTPQDALNGTSVINTIALQKGCDILRVHDVKEAKEAIKIVKKLNGFM